MRPDESTVMKEAAEYVLLPTVHCTLYKYCQNYMYRTVHSYNIFILYIITRLSLQYGYLYITFHLKPMYHNIHPQGFQKKCIITM